MFLDYTVNFEVIFPHYKAKLPPWQGSGGKEPARTGKIALAALAALCYNQFVLGRCKGAAAAADASFLLYGTNRAPQKREHGCERSAFDHDEKTGDRRVPTVG